METRHLVALLAATGAAGAGAAPASAEIIELGASPFAPLVAPTCPVGVAPANCTIILTQVTAMETIRSGTAYPTTVKKAGYIDAITLGLSRLDPNAKQAAADVQFLNASYGGGPEVAVTVLKRVHNPRLRRLLNLSLSARRLSWRPLLRHRKRSYSTAERRKIWRRSSHFKWLS